MFAPDGRYAVSLLYNNVGSDDPGARRESISGTLSYLLARNVRAVVEAGREIDRQAVRFSVGVMAAF